MRIVLALAAASVLAAGCDSGSLDDASSPKAKGAERSWRDELPPAAPPANQPAGPAFAVRALEDRAYAEGRGRDQQTHPDYVARTMPWVADYVASGQTDQKIRHDPYRIGWNGTRGMEQDVEFRNRYDARMRAKLWGPALPFVNPVTGQASSGPFPAIVFIPGVGLPTSDPAVNVYTGFSAYEPQLQQLAESGYVVMAVGLQGQDGSEHFEPPHPMCDPDGSWKESQDFGLREQGECAGQHGPMPAASGDNAEIYNLLAGVLPEVVIVQARLDPESSNRFIVDYYDSFRPRTVFAALDATDWLLSEANPWRARIDADKLAILGHSGGADAAVVVANGDPARRFKASGSWDSYGLPPDTVQPRVPMLLIRSESQNFLGPYVEPPADHIESQYRVYRRFADEGRDALLLTLRGSTHSEWSYIPYALTNPVAPLTNASSKGGLGSHYYTLAWFDRWLKGGRHKDDARRRLLAREFDASADVTSIGSGTFDPLTQQNVPYRIEGESVADHLSVLFLSQAHFDDMACDDLQAACP